MLPFSRRSDMRVTHVRAWVAINGVFVGSLPDRRWPLHPRPTEWEDLETWVRRIAKIYGVSEKEAEMLTEARLQPNGSKKLLAIDGGVSEVYSHSKL